MLLVDRGVVKAPLEDDAIGKCAQPAMRCCAGLRHQRVSIFDAGKRPSAGGNGANGPAIVHASGAISFTLPRSPFSVRVHVPFYVRGSRSEVVGPNNEHGS
jgi:hypothetical protein